MGDLNDTICALSSAPGRAGIAVIRISGPESLSLVREVFVTKGPKSAPRRAVLGTIRDPEGGGKDLDQVLVARLIGAVEPGDELDRPVLPHEGAERMELAVTSQEALGDRQKGVGEGVQIKTRLIRRRPS